MRPCRVTGGAVSICRPGLYWQDMMIRSARRDTLRNLAGTGLILLASALCSFNVTAGELSEVPATLPPGLSLPDLSGQQRNLDAFSGKVLLVNFWASWCTPCLEEMPAIQRLAAAMDAASFAVIAINVGEAQRRVQATARRLELDFPILLDKESAVFNRWGATVLPTTYLLDRSGRIRYVGRGPLEWDRPDIIGMLEKLADPLTRPR